MKKVLTLALSLIMVLAMGVTSFAASVTTVDLGTSTADDDWGFTISMPTGISTMKTPSLSRMMSGDAATLIDGSDVFYALFDSTVP